MTLCLMRELMQLVRHGQAMASHFEQLFGARSKRNLAKLAAEPRVGPNHM